ncbi:hypothetical protein B0H10DRAFT_1991526 [Mycena sp. CBHHK59/15]|nr:hypothetical protein B0H10DRAFT_1991526 [Mycena sp. CBHHK59/15]
MPCPIATLLNTEISNQFVGITIGREGQEIAYKNYFDVPNGIIVAAENFNDKFFYISDKPMSNKANPVKTKDNSLQWNNIVAEQYKSLGGSLADLRHILRFEISNDDTTTIIDQAIKMAALQVVNEWTVVKEGGPGDDMFKALLGTNNGQGAGYMLKDYRTSMAEKAIQAIRVKVHDEYAMIIDYV